MRDWVRCKGWSGRACAAVELCARVAPGILRLRCLSLDPRLRGDDVVFLKGSVLKSRYYRENRYHLAPADEWNFGAALVQQGLHHAVIPAQAGIQGAGETAPVSLRTEQWQEKTTAL